ncbi:MAG: TolC family protein [Deltaproteobacteria bacterium]|nr:TolC family protein [Deltaproteobacteria bacterium]
MKHSILWVYLAVTFVTVGYATPRNGLAGNIFANSSPPQVVLNEQIPVKATTAESSGSITLDWAIDAAIDRHPSLAATWYEIKSRQGEVRQAGILPNPRLFGEIEEFGGTGDYSSTNVMSSKIGISQEVLLGGKIGKGVHEAKAAVGIAELEHQAKIIKVRAVVERRFLDVFILQERLDFQKKELALIEKTHDVVGKRVKVGDTAPLDLTRSQVELVSARIAVEQTRKEFEASRYVLAESWGAKYPAFSSVSGQYNTAFGFTEQGLKVDLQQGPAWLLLEKQVTRAEAVLDLAKAQRIPDIEVEGGVKYFNESNDHAYFLGMSVPLPLFDRNQGGIAEAKASQQKAHYEKTAGFLALHMELQKVWRKFVSTQQAFQSFEAEVLPASQNAFESITKAYKAGEVGVLGLLDAQRTWVEARNIFLDLLYELEKNRIEIKQLIGAGATGSSVPSYSNN